MDVKRGLLTALVDRLSTQKLGFPPEKCSYTVSTVQIPVSNESEHFELTADLYQPVLPKDQKPSGTILIRSPYGRGLVFALLSARPYAARGYICLLVSCRGTFGSGGVFDPWRNEEQDGHAVVHWMRKQKWYTGTFATVSGSYLGFVQWALLRNPPSDMVAATIQCAPHDFSKQLWGTGSLALEWVTWGDNMVHQEETGLVHTYKTINSTKRMRPVLDCTPLSESVKAHFNGRAPWLDFIVDNPNIYHQRYQQMNMSEALERTSIPVFLVSGWYDVFAEQTVQQYIRLRERNVNVAMIIGPWNHMQTGLQSRVHQQSLEWLEEHLAGFKKITQSSPLQYYVTGAEEWRGGKDWPPSTRECIYYIQSDNKLVDTELGLGQDESSSFHYDPQNPTPTMGGNLLVGGGSADDTALATRADVLALASYPLTEHMEVCGKIMVNLIHSSNIRDVDLFVRISEVNAKGRSHGITDAYMRLKPDRGDGATKLQLQLKDCAHRFSKGSRIRLLIAGCSHPQYARPVDRAVHTVHHGKAGISNVVFPITM